MSPVRDHIAFTVKFVTKMGSELAPLDGVKLFPIKILREKIDIFPKIAAQKIRQIVAVSLSQAVNDAASGKFGDRPMTEG